MLINGGTAAACPKWQVMADIYLGFIQVALACKNNGRAFQAQAPFSKPLLT
jgi:hypothetical protein